MSSWQRLARATRLGKMGVLLTVSCSVFSSLSGEKSALADDKKEAVALFDKGRRLMSDPETLAEGCKLLEQSFKLVVRGDTLLNLAYCHERQGRTATAWREYDKAIAEGERVKYSGGIATAMRHRDALGEKLSMFTLEVSEDTAKLDELVVEINGEKWPTERWNTPLTLDPGAFEVKASAKGYLPFVARVELGADKDRKTIKVALEPVPPPPPPPEPPRPEPPPPPPVVEPPKPVARPARPVWPWVVGGTGVALVGVSVGFAIDQRSAARTLNQRCGSDRQSCPVGYDYSTPRSREVRDFGVFVGAGAVGVIALGVSAVGLLPSFRQGSSPNTGLVVAPNSVLYRGEF